MSIMGDRSPAVLFRGWFSTQSEQLVARADSAFISAELSGRWSVDDNRRACAARALEGLWRALWPPLLPQNTWLIWCICFFGDLFSPSCFGGRKGRSRLGLCCWPLSIQLEGSGVWRAQTLTSKSPSIEVGVLSKLCSPEVVFAGAIFLCRYLYSYRRVTGFSRICSCCGCWYDQRPFKSVSEHKCYRTELVTEWPWKNSY